MDTKKIIQNAHIEFEFCFALDRIIMVIENNILTENVEQMHKTASNNIMIYFDVDRSTLEVRTISFVEVGNMLRMQNL